jgi:hypothetical protein
VDQLGLNALGEVLEPGRVTDCYLGLLLPPGPVGEPRPTPSSSLPGLVLVSEHAAHRAALDCTDPASVPSVHACYSFAVKLRAFKPLLDAWP